MRAFSVWTAAYKSLIMSHYRGAGQCIINLS